MLGLFQSSVPAQIKEVVAQFDEKTQQTILKELKKALILKKAKKVDAKIKAKGIKVTDAEIMSICRKARKEANAA